MAEFKPIETQEQFDAAISERIKREKETQAKAYEGYLSPQDYAEKEKDFNEKIETLQNSLKEAEGKISNHDREIAERDNKIKAYETHSVKTRIASELGLSYDAVDFLKGEDEESIRKSATILKGLVGTKQGAAPLANPEGTPGKAEDEALKKTLRKLKGE